MLLTFEISRKLLTLGLSYLHEVVQTNFSADFWTFRNFWLQFREKCGVI